MPAPATNPTTGQADYSAAWAEYYRRQGMNEYADAIIAQARGEAQPGAAAAASAQQPAAVQQQQAQQMAPGAAGNQEQWQQQWQQWQQQWAQQQWAQQGAQGQQQPQQQPSMNNGGQWGPGPAAQ